MKRFKNAVIFCGLLVETLAVAGCTRKSSGSGDPQAAQVTVLRVESMSPEKPGAEHCESGGKQCRPLAPRQILPSRGVVRTFAGGKVSLDFGGGRRIDLGELSETELKRDQVRLARGDFSVETNPVIQSETGHSATTPVKNGLKILAGGQALSAQGNESMTAALSVQPDETLVTIRRGAVTGLEVFGLKSGSSQTGQSIRIADNMGHHLGRGGQELQSLPLLAPRTEEFGELLETRGPRESRGLGTMTGRLPNSEKIVSGVSLKRHYVNVVIRDGFARTEVEEEFENTSPHVLEGRYRFPVPGDASLSRLALWVGENLVEGEVLERSQAARIYSSIVDRPVPRDPALLEWVTGGELSLKVFPILPSKSRRVLLAYNQALSTETGLLRYILPLSLGEDRSTQVADLRITVSLTDRRASLRNVRVFGYEAQVERHGSEHTVTFEARHFAPIQDFVVLADRDADRRAQLSAYVPVWGPSRDKLLASSSPVLAPGPTTMGQFALRVSADLADESLRPEPTRQGKTIVLDTSHSQSESSIRAQAALAYGILRDSSTDEPWAILACDSACKTIQRSNSVGLADAKRWLLELRPGGSSDVAGALATAAHLAKNWFPGEDDGRRQVIFLSDGSASAGELSVDAIAGRVAPSVADIDLRIIGAGRTVDEDTLRGLATKLSATFDLLRSGTSLEERIFELAIALRKPVIRNVRLTLPASLSIDQTQFPALRLGEEFLVTGTIRDLSPGEVLLSGTLQGRPYRLVKELDWQASSDSQNPLIPRLWARDRIERLQAEPDAPSIEAEIVSLSKTYRTMSRHTSFLVLESDKMYADFGIERASKTLLDQPESAFLAPEDELARHVEIDREYVSAASDGETKESPAPGAREEGGAARPASAPAPSPSKSTAPKGMGSLDSSMASGSGFGSDDGFSRLGQGQTAGSGQDAARRRAQGSTRASGDSPLSEEKKKSSQIPWGGPKSRHYSPPRAHLTFGTSDDAWRSWGEENARTLETSLSQDDKSRQRHEAFIRGMLQHGRFAAAHKDALRFIDLDPDYAPARQLLAYSAVLSGDHDLARKMLDVRTETEPRSVKAHAESARSFEAVGDYTRACAHYRSLAEVAPELEDFKARSEACWRDTKEGRPNSIHDASTGKDGQWVIEVQCDPSTRPADCPSPAVVTPFGEVLSPWTPGQGTSTRQKITFLSLRSGTHFIMVLGGAPNARGKVVLTGRHENSVIRFEGGALHTVAQAQVSFW